MTNEDIAKELSAINEQLKTVFSKLEEIKQTLHGNGRQGIIERVTTLEAKDGALGKIIEWGALILTAITAIYGAFFKHGG
jgi:hypothetical protein